MILVKSRSELEIMRRAGMIVYETLELLREAAKPGITTFELDRLAEAHIRKYGAIPSFKGVKGLPGAPDYPGTICASINDEVVHGLPDGRQLKAGDIISIDVGACIDGFHGDAARTFAIGQVSDAAQKLIDVTRQSFFEGIKKAIPGNRIVDISGAIQDVVEAHGFSIVRDYVGHGIGRDMHEYPQIPNYRSRERGPRLQEGMTLAIEPMVNIGGYAVRIHENRWTVQTLDGTLSAHYENTIAITEGEPMILTLPEGVSA